MSPQDKAREVLDKIRDHESAACSCVTVGECQDEEMKLLEAYGLQQRIAEAQLWNQPSESSTRDHEYHAGFDSGCLLCREERLAALKADLAKLETR